jgi:hypothetical protein
MYLGTPLQRDNDNSIISSGKATPTGILCTSEAMPMPVEGEHEGGFGGSVASLLTYAFSPIRDFLIMPMHNENENENVIEAVPESESESNIYTVHVNDEQGQGQDRRKQRISPAENHKTPNVQRTVQRSSFAAAAMLHQTPLRSNVTPTGDYESSFPGTKQHKRQEQCCVTATHDKTNTNLQNQKLVSLPPTINTAATASSTNGNGNSGDRNSLSLGSLPRRERQPMSSLEDLFKAPPSSQQYMYNAPLHLDVHKRRLNKRTKVLRKLVHNAREVHHLDEGRHPWKTKLIKLEELGTASSWLLLVLPYVALGVALILDSVSSLSSTMIHLSLAQSDSASGIGNIRRAWCGGNANGRGNTTIHRFPIVPTPLSPCAYMFSYSLSDIVFQDESDSTMDPSWTTDSSTSSMSDYSKIVGVGVTSGPLYNIPALSAALVGDAIFYNVSSDVLHLVANGDVHYSVAVLQQQNRYWDGPASKQDLNNPLIREENWSVVSYTKPAPLALACTLNHRYQSHVTSPPRQSRDLGTTIVTPENGTNISTKTSASGVFSDNDLTSLLGDNKTRIEKASMFSNAGNPTLHNSHNTTENAKNVFWTCHSPRIVDVLFSMPDTSILNGNAARVEVSFLYHDVSDVITEHLYTIDENDGSVHVVSNVHHTGIRDNDVNDDYFSPTSTANDTASFDNTTGSNSYRGKGSGSETLSSGEQVVTNNLNPSRTPLEIMEELSHSSSFRIAHQRPAYASFVAYVRMCTLVLTSFFLIFWTWSMGTRGGHAAHQKSFYWWESSWVLLPERRFLLLLLLCVLLVQNPFLAFMEFYPDSYSSRQLHTLADTISGVGVQGLLFVWLCLMEGLGFHTAKMTSKRAQQQQAVMERRKAAAYLAQQSQSSNTVTGGRVGGGHTDGVADPPPLDPLPGMSPNTVLPLNGNGRLAFAATKSGGSKRNMNGQPKGHERDHTLTFCETFGDVDGNLSAGSIQVRMKHDLFNCDLEFLLPKLLLLLAGLATVVLTASARYPECDIGSPYHQLRGDSICRQDTLQRYTATYAAGSFAQLGVTGLWVVLIVLATILSAEKLRKQPFISTRPAQLAFRVLVGMLTLGCVAVLIPLLLDLYRDVEKWMPYHGHHHNGNNEDSSASLDSKNCGGNSSVHCDADASQVTFNTSTESAAQGDAWSLVNTLLRLATRASRRFPYIGTASSIGPGKIIYMTVCCLDAAFIFLPSSYFYEQRKLGRDKDKDMLSTPSYQRSTDTDHATEESSHKSGQELERHFLKDKRFVVTLTRKSHTWRILPLPIGRFKSLTKKRRQHLLLTMGDLSSALQNDFRLYPHPANRFLATFGKYSAVFCLETACWLCEASWQSYYNPVGGVPSNIRPAGLENMSLETIGLRLEADIWDEGTDTNAFVCSNISDQVEGEEDTIIVITFRGTANRTNLGTDLRYKQVRKTIISAFPPFLSWHYLKQYVCVCRASLCQKGANASMSVGCPGQRALHSSSRRPISNERSNQCSRTRN